MGWRWWWTVLYSMALGEFPEKRKEVFQGARIAIEVVFYPGKAIRRLPARQAASPRNSQRRRGIPYHTRLLARDTARQVEQATDALTLLLGSVFGQEWGRTIPAADQTRSRIIAIPWPTPMHMVHKA